MSVLYSTFAALALCGATALAAGSSSAAYRASRHNAVALDFSGGLVTSAGGYGGTFLTGINLAVAHNSPVRLGFDSGIMFGRGVGLPILLSIIYSFQNFSSVQPYVAGTVGPIIRLSGPSLQVGNYNVSLDNYAPDVYLGIFVRPGLKFNLTDMLDFVTEVSVGGMTGIFYIAPSIGIQLRV